MIEGKKMQFIQTENFERISKKTIVYERERKTKDSNKLLKLIVKNYSPKTRNSISWIKRTKSQHLNLNFYQYFKQTWIKKYSLKVKVDELSLNLKWK